MSEWTEKLENMETIARECMSAAIRVTDPQGSMPAADTRDQAMQLVIALFDAGNAFRREKKSSTHRATQLARAFFHGLECADILQDGKCGRKKGEPVCGFVAEDGVCTICGRKAICPKHISDFDLHCRYDEGGEISTCEYVCVRWR